MRPWHGKRADNSAVDRWVAASESGEASEPELRRVRCGSEADPESDSGVRGGGRPSDVATLHVDPDLGDDGGGLLVDCLITTTEAAALATWVRSHKHALEYIYITHPHGDHLLGLPAVLQEYPNAKPVALT